MQVNSTYRTRWLASLKVIGQVLFTSKLPKKNKMALASICILSQIELLFSLLIVQLVCYNYTKTFLFTSVLVKVVDIYLHFGEKLLVINWVKSWAKGLEVKNSSETSWCVFTTVLGEKILENDWSLQNFCLWGCKEAVSSLIWHNFSILCGRKKLWLCGGC